MVLNTGMATLQNQWLDGRPLSTARTVAQKALEMVGRLAWESNCRKADVIAPGGSLNTKKIGCVCYQAPLLFAYLSGAMTKSKVDNFAGLSNKNVQSVLFDNLKRDIMLYNSACTVPVGAMVFHGHSNSPIAHVTMYVGRDMVVSTWGASLALSAVDSARGGNSNEARIMKKQINDLIDKKLSPDTVVLPINSFTANAGNSTYVHYTRKAFWDLLNQSTDI